MVIIRRARTAESGLADPPSPTDADYMEQRALPEPSEEEVADADEWLKGRYPDSYRGLNVAIQPEPETYTYGIDELTDMPGEPWDAANVESWRVAARRAVEAFRAESSDG